MKTHFWQSTRVAASPAWRLARLRTTIPLVVLGLVYVLTLGGLPEAAGGLPGYFTDVKPVANVNSSSESITQWAPRISRNGLELYFTRWEGDRVNETGDLWVATRPSTLVDFGEPVRLGSGVNTDIFEANGHTSSDGLRMYFTRVSRDGSRADNYVATRLSTDDEFDNAMPLLNTLFPSGAAGTFLSPNELTIYFYTGEEIVPGNDFPWDLYLSTRNDLGDDFGNPVPLTGVNTTAGTEWYPSVSSDGQFIFFSDYGTGLRADTGSRGGVDVWFGTLNSTTGTFENVLNVGTPINSGSHDSALDVSADWPADGSMVYFFSDRAGGGPGSPNKIWQATWVVPEYLLQPGDADQDGDFDQDDVVQVQLAGRYLSPPGRRTATWEQGDWNGGPGGGPGHPPAGDRRFNQLDIVAALSAGVYLTGPYKANQPAGQANDGQASLVYNAKTSELAVDVAPGTELTSINIDSASGIFTGAADAMNLIGSFDHAAGDSLFKAVFATSFGSLSFGNVAQAGLAEPLVRGDLSVSGSLAGGGSLGDVELIYIPVPEPSSLLLLGLGLLMMAACRRNSRRR